MLAEVEKETHIGSTFMLSYETWQLKYSLDAHYLACLKSYMQTFDNTKLTPESFTHTH